MFRLNTTHIANAIRYIVDFTILWFVFPHLLAQSIIASFVICEYSIGWAMDQNGPAFTQMAVILCKFLFLAAMVAMDLTVLLGVRFAGRALRITG